MAVSVLKAGPYYSSGSITFSSLRQNFRAAQPRNSSGASESINSSKNSGPIKASELLRRTSTSDTNPVVPNATENASIVSSQSNWSVSHFRNSIKFYYIAQSGTNTNLDIDAQSWNTNLDKNIVKIAFINGVCGSNSTSSTAASFNATAYNMTIDVFGIIYGAGGAGGTSSSISGKIGGDALSMSGSGSNRVIRVRSSGAVYAGGGGGERGVTGANGSSGTCVESTTKSACRNCPGCDGGWYNDGGCYDGWHCSRRQECNRWGNCWWVSDGNTKYQKCRKNTWVGGGAGGAGGNGGPGRGYNYLSGSLSGSSGSAGGGYGGCPGSWSPQPSGGQTGETGGSGGNWGQNGANTSNSGSGGSSGRAIIGSNYTVTGSTGSVNIKGAY